MFRTFSSTDRRARLVVRRARRLAADRDDLLAAARGGDVRAVGHLCDRHGGALYGLAGMILGDSAQAETVVTEAIARACTDPEASVVSGGSLRRDLARLTYLYATRCLDEAERSVPGTALARNDQARQQRSAVALVQCGGHTVSDVADLLGLSEPGVAVLLTHALRELEAADRRAAADELHSSGRAGRPT